jgi:hypothetical protein
MVLLDQMDQILYLDLLLLQVVVVEGQQIQQMDNQVVLVVEAVVVQVVIQEGQELLVKVMAVDQLQEMYGAVQVVEVLADQVMVVEDNFLDMLEELEFHHQLTVQPHIVLVVAVVVVTLLVRLVVMAVMVVEEKVAIIVEQVL